MTPSELYALMQRQVEPGNFLLKGYSGRGMRGQECLAITGTWSDCLKIIAEVIKSLHDDFMSASYDSVEPIDDGEFHTAVDALLEFSFDNMGYDVVVYWPKLLNVNKS